MMAGFSLKVKTKTGQQHIVSNLEQNTTVRILKNLITELTNIPEDAMHVVLGFPPFKPLDFNKDDELILAIGISNGDTLIVQEKQISEEERNQLAAKKRLEEDEKLAKELAAQSEGGSGILLKQIVPSDNSCLFTSIGYVLTGKVDPESSQYMREIIAATVNADKQEYNEGILGRPNDEYCAWILQPESWGGAIEVSILSAYHGIEFDVVDITNAIINRFGEDKNYGMRAFLLFDGIHYDPLYLESTTGEPPKTIFPIEDNAVYLQAEQLAQEAKSSRQFTDVNKFTLKCNVCDCHLKGQEEAQQHAKKTGHINFGEI
ncbi:ubiquitin thioesterase OTU1 [Toxorhynchites rutilus septentrionalis]|uniref:ubiquitin thioesterase OTU1 n=1 Tax=Toxorhynchites rutilus septentrionalis TaxID=329112 RepID=UPI00247A1B89|nr:ubiquitin thioesterase OTU1 [Toxorhynchites rutilus septentrionalis]